MGSPSFPTLLFIFFLEKVGMKVRRVRSYTSRAKTWPWLSVCRRTPTQSLQGTCGKGRVRCQSGACCKGAACCEDWPVARIEHVVKAEPDAKAEQEDGWPQPRGCDRAADGSCPVVGFAWHVPGLGLARGLAAQPTQSWMVLRGLRLFLASRPRSGLAQVLQPAPGMQRAS